MRTKIMLALLCLMTSAVCFGEWVYLGDVQYIVYSYGYDAPAGRYMTSCRFTMTSEPENVYIRFMDESRNVIYSQDFTGVTMGSTYSSTCPIPAARVEISNGSWGHHSRSEFWVNLADYHAEPPVISPAGGIIRPNAEVISITSPQGSSAKIYYTTDGSTPTTSSLPYGGTFSLDASATVKAIAIYKTLMSGVTAKTFQIGWSPPGISPTGGGFQSGDEIEVIISNSPSNNGEGTLQFRYNYGGSQSSWTSYVNPIIITETSTLEAKVVGTDGESDIVSETYTFTMAQVETPAISPQGGYFETAPPEITISCATPGATIYYSINKDVVKSAANIYKGAFSLPINSNPDTAWNLLQPDTSGSFSTSYRVYAMAAKNGMSDSATVSRVYVIGGGLPPAQPPSNDGGVTVDGSGSFTGSDGQTYTLPDYTDYLNHRNDLVDTLQTAATPEDQGTVADQIHDLDDSYYNDVNNYYNEYNTIVNPPDPGNTGNTGGGGNDNSGGGTDTNTATGSSNSPASTSTSVIPAAVQSDDSGNGNLLFLGGAAAGTALLPSLLENPDGKALAPEDPGNEPDPDSYARKVYFTK
ncbi:MAG: chitobiase/beta-hexosaminidase C-terminal domain-containing protein [Victivallales bacterium]